MKIRVEKWSDLSQEEKEKRLRRSEEDISQALGGVKTIVDEVRHRGDEALREFTLRFDGVDLGDLPLEATAEEFRQARREMDPALRAAIDQGISHVKAFHQTQIPREPRPEEYKELLPGLRVAEIPRPIPSAGLYVPRGKGSFPSMLYMLAVPAVLAGVNPLVVTTPPGPEGRIDAATLYTAQECGVHRVFRVGGAQAIAALAWGTESLPRTAKIEGPGNYYVSAARRLVSSVTDVGMPAGPSESVILADGTTPAEKVAVDLLVEAEHGSDSSALLITPSRKLADQVAQRLPPLIEELPEPRRTFVMDVLSGYGGILLVDSLEEAISLSNRLAPEHLMIHCREAREILPRITNAGEILLGEHTPFSAANYCCGVNAVLPTGGRAATYSAISVRDFMKYSSVVEADEEGLRGIADSVKTLADYEGFPAHAKALRLRFPD